MPSSTEPQQIGPYSLIEPVSAGGMGEIYRAHHAGAGRTVAIKRVSRLFARQPGFIAAFEREARAAALLQHPHIIPIFDVARDDEDLPYLVMPYMSGGNLAGLLTEHPNGMPLERVLCINQEIAGALDYLHARGIVHRDLKPGNILLDGDGHAYITDFGVARLAGQLEKPGGVQPGTPEYQAPELLEGKPATAASDRWGLAAVCFEMLTGRPFMAYGEVSILGAIRPDLPPEALLALARTLDEIPDERPASAMSFAIALNDACGMHQPCENRPMREVFVSPLEVRRNPLTPVDQPTSDEVLQKAPPAPQPPAAMPQPWGQKPLRRRQETPPPGDPQVTPGLTESQKRTPPWIPGVAASQSSEQGGAAAFPSDDLPDTPPYAPAGLAPSVLPPTQGAVPTPLPLDPYHDTPPWIPDALTDLPPRLPAPPASPPRPAPVPAPEDRPTEAPTRQSFKAAGERLAPASSAPPTERHKAVPLPAEVAAPTAEPREAPVVPPPAASSAPTVQQPAAPKPPAASLDRRWELLSGPAPLPAAAPTRSRFSRRRRPLLPGEQLAIRIAVGFLVGLALLLFYLVMSSLNAAG